MSKSVILQFRDVKFFHEPVVVVAVCAGLCRFVLIGQNVEICIDHLLHGLYHCQQLFADRYLSTGVHSLWGVDDKLRMFLLTFHHIYSFDGALHGDCSVSHIDVAPLQSADFANAQSCAQADVDTEAHEGEVVLHIVQYLFVIGHGENFKFLIGSTDIVRV